LRLAHLPSGVGYATGLRTRSRAEYTVLEEPQMPAMTTVLDQAHNALHQKLFMMQGVPTESQECGPV
jgi:hypothetical protein